MSPTLKRRSTPSRASAERTASRAEGLEWMSPRIPYRNRISLSADLERGLGVHLTDFFHFSGSYISIKLRVDRLDQPGHSIRLDLDDHEHRTVGLVLDRADQCQGIRQGLDGPPETDPLNLAPVGHAQLL